MRVIKFLSPLKPLKPAYHLFLKVFKIRRVLDAKAYVDTVKKSGALQLELLKKEDCVPSSKVLEIGCGYLHLGRYLIDFLDKSNYVGVDPNDWLRNLAVKKDELSELIHRKAAVFLNNENFDATEVGKEFDFIFSHSVLSHAAHWQLNQYLENCLKVLAEEGVILASIRLAEGNEFGSKGNNGEDSGCQEWKYPGVSYFTLATVKETAKKLGLSAIYKPEYTAFYIQERPCEYHDWIVFRRNKGSNRQNS